MSQYQNAPGASQEEFDNLSEQIANLETGTSGIGLTRITTDVDSAYPKNYGVGFFVFNGQNVSHSPSTAWFFMIAFRAENSFITQVAFNMTGSNNIYQRQFSVGTTGTSWGKMNA